MSKICTYTFLTVVVVDLLATSGDVSRTWTSPVLPKLYSTNPEVNPLNEPITQLQESWIGSIINIGSVVGAFPFGYISTKFGRKIALLTIALPHIVAFVILALASNIYYYYFARFLVGLAGGGGYSILPLYISEIAEDSNRGMLSVSLNVFWTFGNLLPYIFGPFLTMFWFNLTLSTIPIIFFLIFLLMGTESPYYLLQNARLSEAENSLLKLRSGDKSSVQEEILKIQNSLEKSPTGNLMTLLKSKTNLKACAITLSLIIFQQLSGIAAVLFYTQLIFQSAGSSLAPEISSIIVGLVLLFSSVITPIFAEKLGRRIFLMASSSGMMVCLLLLGAYFYCKESLLLNVEFLNWLPIVSLLFFISFFSVGYGSIPWTLGSELFSVDIKPIGTSLVTSCCFLFSFLVTKFFNNLNSIAGKGGTFWVFSGFCLLATVFVKFWVPETRGKSFIEIQKLLNK